MEKILCKNCNRMKPIDDFFKSPYYKNRYNRIHNCKTCYNKLREKKVVIVDIICDMCGTVFQASNKYKYCSKRCSKEAGAYKQKLRRAKFLKNNPDKRKEYAMKSRIRVKAVSRVTVKKSIESGKRYTHYTEEEVALIKETKNGKYRYTTMELSSMIGRSVLAIRSKRRKLK